MASLVSVLLAYLLFSILGILRSPSSQRRALLLLAAVAALVIALGWALSPQQSLMLSLAAAALMGFVALALSLRSALRGDRLAWVAVAGVVFMLVAIAGLSWAALDRQHGREGKQESGRQQGLVGQAHAPQMIVGRSS